MSKPKTKKPPFKATNYFVCTCARDTQMNLDEMIEHMKTVHKLRSKASRRGTRRMVLHLDTPDAYYSNYEWKFGGVVLHQYCANPRTKELSTVRSYLNVP